MHIIKLNKALVRGASLIELMVALVLGMVLIVGVVAMETNTITFSYSAIAANKMSFEMENTLNLIVADLRRAGYWSNAYLQAGTNLNSNPFLTGTTNISINAGRNCILFGYDRDKNGTLNTTGNASANEHFGYRLSNGAIQALTTDTDYSCTSASSAWENITDPKIMTITVLTFTLTSRIVTLSSGSTSTIRYITITMTAQQVNDTATTTTLTQSVRVRQDYYSP